MHPAALIALSTLLQATPAVSPASLVEDVRKLASANANEARFEALTAMLRARNLAFDVEPIALAKQVPNEPRTEGRNVVVTLGDGAAQMVIGAHYDAARLPDGTLSRGAVDNAASSVLLVRLAEMLRAETLPIRLKIVWFDMEELGLVGSAGYVRAHAADRIVAMLNFDINAYGDTVLFGPSERVENGALRRTLLQTCAAEERSCVGFPQMPPGDDRPFVEAGIPALSIASLPAVEVHQLWLLMNAGQQSGLAKDHAPAILQTIHTAADTTATIDGESMARTLRFALTLIRSAARG